MNCILASAGVREKCAENVYARGAEALRCSHRSARLRKGHEGYARRISWVGEQGMKLYDPPEQPNAFRGYTGACFRRLFAIH